MDLRKLLVTASTYTLVMVMASCTEPTVSNDGGGEKVKPADNYMSFCSQCHGADGKLGLAGAADITTSVLNSDAKKDIITHGKGAMMPYKDMLTEDEIDALVAYIENDLPTL